MREGVEVTSLGAAPTAASCSRRPEGRSAPRGGRLRPAPTSARTGRRRPRRCPATCSSSTSTDYRNPAALPDGRGARGRQRPVRLPDRRGAPRGRPRRVPGVRPGAVAAAADRRSRPGLVGARDRLPRPAGVAALPEPRRAAVRATCSRPATTAATTSTCGRSSGWASRCSATSRAPTDRHARFAPDLAASVAWGDQRHAAVHGAGARSSWPSAACRSPSVPEPEPFARRRREELDLAGFGAVIFAGGFRPDYASWVAHPRRLRRARLPDPRDGASTVADGPVLRRRPLPAQAQVVAARRRRRGRRDRRRQGRGPAQSSSRKPIFERHLVVGDGAALADLAADVEHLEPVEVPERLRGLGDRAVDGLGRRPRARTR